MITEDMNKCFEILNKDLATHGQINGFDLKFDLESFSNIVNNPLTRGELLRVAKNGKIINISQYTKDIKLGRHLINKSIDVEKLTELLCYGATVTIDSLEYYNKEIKKICENMSCFFNDNVSATAYITGPGHQGFLPHTDEEEVLIIQTYGEKIWRYDSSVKVNTRSSILNKGALDNIEPIELKYGDFITLPSGTPHVAQTKDSISIHINFSYEKDTYFDIIQRTISENSKLEIENLFSIPIYDGNLEKNISNIVSDLLKNIHAKKYKNENLSEVFKSWDMLKNKDSTLIRNQKIEIIKNDDHLQIKSGSKNLNISLTDKTDELKILSINSKTNIENDPDLYNLFFVLIGLKILSIKEK
ncbi:hypothetical protein F971_03205 [Acinetobacter vivianii]|uniref:Ribosomal oxygenase 2 n=1 Tax=Acinetobacter vivianii TaxID=1776742 RepID=N8W378_9GAMM|nr:cupin domain-containing protein [Acinetobacter vivianii]ENU91298.1 hypothetical protein F971_03205 [Acinetobacter vivianii]